ncbi:MAG: family 78 glycoside hydrolase catalytic domain [Proteobacteria bacterium]|nr:family 78 glycoside hydrolase catalytic domain [Pseudomonadota bacterium]
MNPLILARAPRFSWINDSAQSAYRLTCATDPRNLARGRNLVWDSGRVESPAAFDVGYGGPSPAPGQRIWWQVQVWTPRGATAVSRPAFWEPALPADGWSAQWLAVEHPDARADREAGLHWIGGTGYQAIGAARAYRTAFDAPATGPAEFLLSANQLDGVWLNGEQVEAEGPEPAAWTTFSRFRLDLRPGSNVLAFSLVRPSGYGALPVAAGLLKLHDGSGGTLRVTTAQGWRTTLAPKGDWFASAFDDSSWEIASTPQQLPNGEPWLPTPAMLLRKSFATNRPIRSARLYATALGAYEAWINGHRVGDQMLAPEMTDPGKRVLYQAHDVTDLLKGGDNVFGLWVGDGWYGSEYSSESRFHFGPAPCRVLAQIEIVHDDGSRETIGTGPGWKTAPSAVLASEIYDGEIHDARLEIDGWSEPGFDDLAWEDARPAEALPVAIEPQDSPPVRVTQTLEAVSMAEVRPGVHVFDFGQNFAGWPRLKVRGQAGDRIEMRFAEVLGADGDVDQTNLRTALALDVYVVRGDREETWTPRFTYHGFRYVQVKGLRQAPTHDTLMGLVGHSDLDFIGAFRVGDPVIEKFWRNSVWSQRSNFFGLPTDCPQRNERLGWMGDAQVFWPAAAFNMDVQAYTARVMGDVRHGQSAKGGFPDVIPPFFHGLEMTSPGWADAGIVLPHVAWMRSGDTQVIERNWVAMERHMAYILSENPNHLWARSRGSDFGDWLAVDAVNPGDATTPLDLVSTAYWARCARMMADMAAATGRTDDALRHKELFAAIRTAFNAAYVRPDGQIGNGSQTSLILPIAFGLLDDAAKAEAGRRLVTDIRRRDDTLSTGFLGTPHILDALAESGHTELAITLLAQRRFPSWGHMVEKGATTMWERWNSDTADVSMNSFNHYAFGAIVDFMFRRVAGIDPIEPGFRRFRVAPIIDRRLGNAGADLMTPLGRIRTDWRIKGTQAILDIEVPAGSEAEVFCPLPSGWRRGPDTQGESRLTLGYGQARLTASI